VLQTGRPPRRQAVPYVSDFFDFSIYLDADEDVLLRWYVDRLSGAARHRLQRSAVYFHRYSKLSDEDAVKTASSIWSRINLANLNENILPTVSARRPDPHKGREH